MIERWHKLGEVLKHWPAWLVIIIGVLLHIGKSSGYVPDSVTPERLQTLIVDFYDLIGAALLLFMKPGGANGRN